MNLKRISDAVSLKAYKNLKEISPDNFYFVIANKLANALERDIESISGKALGNEYKITSRGGKTTIEIANQTFISNQKSTVKVIEDLVKQMFDAEFNGLEINRPNKRILLDDRNEFKQAIGTVFPSMYAKVKKGNPLANNQPNNSNFLTELQFDILKESRKAFKPDQYRKHELGGEVYYLKKGVYLYDATEDLQDLGLKLAPISLKEYSDDLYKHSQDAKKFYDELEHFTTYCIIKNALFEFTYIDGTIKITRKL